MCYMKKNTLKSSKSKILSGYLVLPGDKSISHRAIILSSLAIGNSKIYGLLESDDVINTVKSIRNLGVTILKKKDHYLVEGNGGIFKKKTQQLYFGNSGTGVRLITGMLATKKINIILTGDESLSTRPMQRVIDPLNLIGAKIESNNGKLPIIINKSEILMPEKFISEIGSAQIKSAFLLAALNISGTCTYIEKKPSRNHSEIMLKNFGAKISVKKSGTSKIIKIFGSTPLESKNVRVPGDFSSAAFIIVAVLLVPGSKVIFENLGLNFYRTGLIDVLKKMGAQIKVKRTYLVNGERVGDLEVVSSKLKSINLDGGISARMIDEYPILFVAASFADGITFLRNLEELKFKESDRLKSMAEALRKCGVKINVKNDSIKIYGKKTQKGGCQIKTFKDHRIAMAMLIFGMISEEPVSVDEIGMIETSFPDFYLVMKKIGANLEYI